jgi:hypothetical protein
LEDLRQKMRTRVLRARDDQEEDPGVLKMGENYKGEGGEGGKSWQLLRSRNPPKKKKKSRAKKMEAQNQGQ